MKCRNPPIVFVRIRSPRAKSTSTHIRSHFHLQYRKILNSDDKIPVRYFHYLPPHCPEAFYAKKHGKRLESMHAATEATTLTT